MSYIKIKEKKSIKQLKKCDFLLNMASIVQKIKSKNLEDEYKKEIKKKGK